MEQMRVVLHGGPWDGREIAVEKGKTEIKLLERQPMSLRSYDPRQDGKPAIRHGIYRQRRTEPEYQHVFDFMGMTND